MEMVVNYDIVLKKPWVEIEFQNLVYRLKVSSWELSTVCVISTKFNNNILQTVSRLHYTIPQERSLNQLTSSESSLDSSEKFH